MAILATIELAVGDVDALLAAKKALMDPIAEQVFPANGHLWQLAVRTDDGVMLLNLWESEHGRDRANADPGLAAAREAVLERSGARATYRSYSVLSFVETRPAD